MLKLVSERGYAGAKTRDVAAEAGVTELTLFRHFGSKERMFEEVLKNYTFIPRFKNLMPELAGLSAEDAIELIASRYLETLLERKPLIKILHAEVHTYPESIRTVYNNFMREMQGTLSAYIQSLQKQGILNHDMSAIIASRMFLWVLFSYFRTEVIMNNGGVKKKDVREIVRIFSRGVLPRTSGADGGGAS
ncbi:MAG: TetR/AcrR family transcriptional regulator [Nitrospiraceae bacterium]|nr:TetR/AcrR family transcriptional regulator [Nitrospiraceae bacterium]